MVRVYDLHRPEKVRIVWAPRAPTWNLRTDEDATLTNLAFRELVSALNP